MLNCDVHFIIQYNYFSFKNFIRVKDVINLLGGHVFNIIFISQKNKNNNLEFFFNLTYRVRS